MLMQAVIVSASRRGGHGEGPDGGEATVLDGIAELFGSESWDLTLDVTSPSGERFQHSGRYKIANRLGGVRRSLKRWQPVPGLTVPVRVSDDRSTVDIEWDAFVKAGGIEQAVQRTAGRAAERGAEQGAAATGAMLAKNPKKAAKQRQFALQHGPEMADQVPTGVRPAREFQAYISGLVQGGALSQQEGDELLKRAGLA